MFNLFSFVFNGCSFAVQIMQKASVGFKRAKEAEKDLRKEQKRAEKAEKEYSF